MAKSKTSKKSRKKKNNYTKRKDLTKGNLKKHILAIAVPASIGFFFQTMYNVTDSFFAGQINTEALAALGATFPIFFIIIALASGISQGGAALISNALGEKDKKKARMFSSQAISFGIILSVFLTIIGLLAGEYLLTFINTSEKFLQYATQYLNIIFFSAIFFISARSFNSMLIATGDTKKLRNFLITGFFLNIALDYWFINGGLGVPAMGIGGIALATVIIQALGSAYMFFKAKDTGLLSDTCCWDFIPKKDAFIEISRHGFPASINMMTVAAGFFIKNVFLGDFGQEAIAAYGASLRIEQIVLLPAIGLNFAALSIIGQNHGAKKIGRIKATLKKTLLYGNLIMVPGALLMFFFGRALLGFFTDNPEVISIGAFYLKIMAFATWAYVTMFICVSALQGLKKPMFALYIGIVRQLILPSMLFPLFAYYFGLGISGIWWAIITIIWGSTLIAVAYTIFIIKKKEKEFR